MVEYQLRGIVKHIRPQLTEEGKIKIGQRSEKTAKTGSGKNIRLPEKLDHIIVVENKKDSADNWVKHPIMKELGDSPREIPVRLLFNDWRQNLFTEFRLLNNKGRILCHGDGSKAWRKLQGQEERELVDCDPATCKYFYKNRPDHIGCKWYGVLSCMIEGVDRIGSVFKFRTTSEITIQSLATSMVQIAYLTNGILADIPLKLVVRPMTINPESVDMSVRVYIVNLEWAGTKDGLRKKAISIIEENKKALQEWQDAGIEQPKLLMQPIEQIDNAQDIQMLSEEHFFDVELEEKDMEATPSPANAIREIAGEGVEQPEATPIPLMGIDEKKHGKLHMPSLFRKKKVEAAIQPPEKIEPPKEESGDSKGVLS